MDLQCDFLNDDTKNSLTQLTLHNLEQFWPYFLLDWIEVVILFYPARPETYLAVSHDFCFFGR